MAKNAVKKTGNKGGGAYHILMFVQDSTPYIKKFKTTDEMGKFIDAFNKKYPDEQAINSGYWLDFCITDITGDLHLLCEGVKVV